MGQNEFAANEFDFLFENALIVDVELLDIFLVRWPMRFRAVEQTDQIVSWNSPLLS